jgi:hypothetical protein
VVFNEGLMPAGPPRTEADMEQAENLHKVCVGVCVGVCGGGGGQGGRECGEEGRAGGGEGGDVDDTIATRYGVCVPGGGVGGRIWVVVCQQGHPALRQTWSRLKTSTRFSGAGSCWRGGTTCQCVHVCIQGGVGAGRGWPRKCDT